MSLKSVKDMKPKLLIGKMDKIGLNILFHNVYFRGIMFTALGFCAGLKYFATQRRILSDSYKVMIQIHSKFIQKLVMGRI